MAGDDRPTRIRPWDACGLVVLRGIAVGPDHAVGVGFEVQPVAAFGANSAGGAVTFEVPIVVDEPMVMSTQQHEVVDVGGSAAGSVG